MASNVSTIDGMGFEEVNQDQSFTETISGTNIYGDNLWVNGTIEATIISGAQANFIDVIVDDDITAHVLSTENGQVFSTSYQNASDVYGNRVRAGSVLMGDDGKGRIDFTNNWVGAGPGQADSYFITLSPRNWTLPSASNEPGSATSFAISGTRRGSGCWVIGPSGTVADWIAVGY